MRIRREAPGIREVRIVSLLLAAATVMAAGDQSASTYTFKTIAKTGQSDGQVTFGPYFQPGGINNWGEISFAPAVQSGGESVFLASGNSLIKVRAAGDPLLGGAKFGYNLGPVPMMAGGDTAFISTDLSLPEPWGLAAGVYRTVFGIPIPIPVMLPGVTRAPGGSVFQGAAFNVQMNNSYETVFPGMICSTAPSSVPNPLPNPCSTGKLAFGIYQANILGQIDAIVQPGSPAPGGSTFDYAQVPFNNNSGDVAFDGHVFGEVCNDPQGQQSFRIFCAESVYLRDGRSGALVSIAHQGRPSPVSGKQYYSAFAPVLNDLGDLVFLADLSANGTQENAVFLYTHGATITIAKPGDSMPGGGIFKQAGTFPHNAYLNNNLEVAFIGTLNSGDQGLYLWKNGAILLVAKTGMKVDGGATIANLDDFGAGAASTQIATNDHGQIIFAANVTAGGGAILVATPR